MWRIQEQRSKKLQTASEVFKALNLHAGQTRGTNSCNTGTDETKTTNKVLNQQLHQIEASSSCETGTDLTKTASKVLNQQPHQIEASNSFETGTDLAKTASEVLNRQVRQKRASNSYKTGTDVNKEPNSATSTCQSSDDEWSPGSENPSSDASEVENPFFSDESKSEESDGTIDDCDDCQFNKPITTSYCEPDSTTKKVNLVGSTIEDVCPDSSDNEERPQSPVLPYLNEIFSKKVTAVAGHHLSDAKRKYNKHHSCVYCKKMYTKISRHLEQVHKSETEVAFALSLRKGSKERREQWCGLVKKGDFMHNQQVMREGTGYLIPKKRPKEDGDVFCYVTCDNCLGLYEKKLLYKHRKKCKPNRSNKRNQDLLVTSTINDMEFNNHILSSMTSDEVSFTAKQDQLIIHFGTTLFKKSRSISHQYQYIKQKMRELAKFLLAVRNLSNEYEALSLTDCIKPRMFSTALDAVKVIAGFDESTNGYGTPSLALKIGHSLKKCANLLKSQAIQAGNDVARKDVDDFVELYTSDWCHEISSAALQTLHKKQFNNPKRIPLASDIRKLNQTLEEAATLSEGQLRRQPNPSNWKRLAEATLVQVVLFNRRRGGETERMETEQFVHGVMIGKTKQEEILQSLSPFERRLIETIERIEIRGKRGRRVPVLLPQNIKKRIDALIDFREASSVEPNNKYIFARQNSQLPIRTSDVIRKFAGVCNASCPELLTSTSLRKHVATISQILNLKRNDLDSLASFLGHDINVHRNFYRLPEDTVQVAKVGKLLIELEKGSISKHKGLSLDEINIEDDTVVPDEDDADIFEDGKFSENTGDCNATEPCENTDDCNATEPCENTDDWNEPGPSSSKERKRKQKPPKKPTSRKPWSNVEKSAVQRQLGRFFALDRLPGKHEVEEAQRSEPCLKSRPWAQIKYFIKNIKSKKLSK